MTNIFAVIQKINLLSRFISAFSCVIQANAHDMGTPKLKCSGYERDFSLIHR